jgi:hypothetical protein
MNKDGGYMSRERNRILRILIALALLASAATAKEGQRVSSEPAASKKTDKQQIAVFAKAPYSQKDWAEGETVGALEEALLNNGFRLVARKDLKTAMEELSFGVNALFNQEKAVEVGNLLSAKYLITAEIQSITKKSRKPFDPRNMIPGNKSFNGVKTSVRIRVIETETGQIKETKRYEKETKEKAYNADDPEEAVIEGYRDLIGEIANEFAELIASLLPEARTTTKPKTKIVPETTPEKESSSKDKAPAKPLDSSKNLTQAKESSTKSPTQTKENSAKTPDSPNHAKTTTPPPTSGSTTTTSLPAITDGEVVSIDNTRVLVDLTGIQVGQILEVYTRRERLENRNKEFLGYDYKKDDICARLRVIEVKAKVVVAAIQETFDLKGVRDSTMRPDRIYKFFPVKIAN